MATGKPLAGYCVIEIGHSVAAPYAGLILGELGADVIKVEEPKSGDHARGWGPPFHEAGTPYFVALNRSKRSVTLDLASAESRDRLEQLILEQGDAVICNLRPGAAKRYGLGADQLLKRKPALVYCDIGAFGSLGPMADRPGYDPLMQAFGGMMSITGENETRPPVRVGVSVIDMGAGLWAAIGILSSLLERTRTGRGGLVETSLYEVALAWTSIQIARVLSFPGVPKPNGSGAVGIVPYQAFLASDGWIVIAAGNDSLFVKLTKALDMPALADDPRYRTNGERVKNRDVLIPILEARIAGIAIADLRAALDKHDVPNAPVQKLNQVVKDPQTVALGIIQEGPSGTLPTVGLPLRFDGARPVYDRGAPRLGQHTAEVLGAKK